MWRVLSVATIVIAAATTSMSPASAMAQMVCGKRADVLTGFASTYHEVRSAIGVTDQGGLLEVLISPTGAWTMLVTKPGGLTCIIGTGRDWFTRPAPGSEGTT
jgi:hypothetical protein